MSQLCCRELILFSVVFIHFDFMGILLHVCLSFITRIKVKNVGKQYMITITVCVTVHVPLMFILLYFFFFLGLR